MAGVPARVIGRFESICEKYVTESDAVGKGGYKAEACWKRFYEMHDSAPEKVDSADTNSMQGE